MRRILAAMLVAMFTGAVAGPIVASVKAGCRMCAKACCCAPKQSADRCRISLPCGAEGSSEAPGGPQGPSKPAVLPTIGGLPVALTRDPVFETARHQLTDPFEAPPEHPPRLSIS